MFCGHKVLDPGFVLHNFFLAYSKYVLTPILCCHAQREALDEGGRNYEAAVSLTQLSVSPLPFQGLTLCYDIGSYTYLSGSVLYNSQEVKDCPLTYTTFSLTFFALLVALHFRPLSHILNGQRFETA